MTASLSYWPAIQCLRLSAEDERLPDVEAQRSQWEVWGCGRGRGRGREKLTRGSFTSHQASGNTSNSHRELIYATHILIPDSVMEWYGGETRIERIWHTSSISFFCFWTVKDELRDSRKRQNAKTSQEGERPLRWMAVFQKYDKNHGPELVCNKENSPHDNVGADGCHKKGHEQNKNWSR